MGSGRLIFHPEARFPLSAMQCGPWGQREVMLLLALLLINAALPASTEHPAAGITRRITNNRRVSAISLSLPGGHLAGNGDVGLAVGSAEQGPGLTLAMGKNDFWGMPGEHVTFGGTFNHFSPGWLTLVVSPPGGRRAGWNASASASVNSSQRLLDGRLTLDSGDLSPGGYGIRSEAIVLSHDGAPRNTVLVNFSLTCPTGRATAVVTANLSSDNAWVLPVAAEITTSSGGSSRDNNGGSDFPVLQLRKQNQPTPWHPTLLTPCDADLILEDGLRTFAVDSATSQLQVAGNSTTAGSSALPRLCFATRPQDQRVITVPCAAAANVRSRAHAVAAAPTPTEWFWRAGSGRVTSADGHRCMAVEDTNSTRCKPCPWGSNGGCPNQPPPRTQCRWQQYEITARPCGHAGQLSNTSLEWRFEPAAASAAGAGMLRAVLRSAPLGVQGEKLPTFRKYCLTAAVRQEQIELA
jgi:hypothetical protein